MRSKVPAFVLALLGAIVWGQVALAHGLPQSLNSIQYNPEEEKAAAFLFEAEEELQSIAEQHSFIAWNYASNITDENEKAKLESQSKVDEVNLRLGTEAKKFDLDKIVDQDLRRKLKWVRNLRVSALSPEKLERYHEVTNAMSKIYSTAKVPSLGNPEKLLSLEPELTEILAKSQNLTELEYYWTEWRRVTGSKMRDHFFENIALTNEAARLNDHKDGTEMKVEPYESDTFVKEMEDTWNGLKPLYEQLHAYVRSKLLDKYGDEVIDPKGPMPAHLLGNMWAQHWNNLATMLRPYPEKSSVDVDQAMKDQGWTPKIMFQKAEDFFVSIGLDPMPDEFWNGSIIEKPADGRELVCHPSAWDFNNGKDYRIKQCTRVNAEDFITVNHEMGHTQYQRSYRNLSFLFRDGANPGFHEGIGDIMSLAVGTASYYKRLGLVDDSVDITDDEIDINVLFETALRKLVFMPFAYLVDKYRWDLYSGIAPLDELNCHWVKLRADIQGVSPPKPRDETQFDAGAKFHVAANADYVQYFTAHIYEFQFYKTLCEVSGQYASGDKDKPLHRCNFYGSKEAGTKLLEILKLGKSRLWKEVMEIMTGTPNMDTGAFREYFAPLEKWLTKYNKEKNNLVGWTVPDYNKLCSKTVSPS